MLIWCLSLGSREVTALHCGKRPPTPRQDLIVTNETEYTPWKSTENGRPAGHDFGEISMAGGKGPTETTFKFTFARSEDSDKAPYEVPHGALSPPACTLCGATRL